MTDESSPSFHIPDLYYTSLFEALPGSCILLQNNAPHYTVLAVTPEYLAQTGYRKEAITGKGVFEMSPANPDDPTDTGASDLRNSLEHVRLHKEPHQLPIQRYDIAGENGSFSVRYWRASNKPVFSPDGEVACIIHSADDITKQVKAREREVQIEGIEKAFGLFMHAPIVVWMVNGDDYVLEMANEAAFKLWGKGPDEIIGKPILEGLPELEGQGIIELFNKVRTSGQPFITHEVPESSIVNGKKEQHYINLVYQPYYSNGSKASGVFTISHDVTEQVKARQKAQQSEEAQKRFQFMADNAQDSFILMREDGSFAYLNQKALEEWGYTKEEAKDIRVPDVDLIYHEDAFAEVFAKAQQGERLQFETLHRRKDGHVYPVEVNMNAITLNGAPHLFAVARNITGRKKAEEALRESEVRFRNMVEQAPVAITLTRGMDVVIESINAPMLQLMNKSSMEEVLGKKMLEVLPELKGQPALEIVLDVQKTGIPFRGDEQPVNLFVNGELKRHYFNFSYTPIMEGGVVAAVLHVAIDVTEPVLAKRKIEESEGRFRLLADASPNLIWMLKPDGSYGYVNKTTLDFLNITQEQIEAAGWPPFLHRDDVEPATRAIAKAIQNQRPYEMEHRLRHKDGEYRWVLSHAIPAYDANGNVFAYVGSSIDIHEAKKNRQELQTALEQVRLSKEAAELGTFDLDLEKGTMHWDDRCRNLFGISHHGPVTYEKDFVEGLHPEDRVRILKVIDKAFIKPVSNGDYDVEYRTIGAEDGVVRWIRAKGKVYFDAQEKPVRFIGSVLDITEQVTIIQRIERLVEDRTKELAQANESLLQANKELLRSNANLEEFTYAASHDLKEPIRKIIIFSNQLKSQLAGQLKENESRLLGRIQSATERMGNLVDDLLLYSHVTQRPQQTESIDLNQKVQRVLEDLELDIEEKNAIIEVAKLPVVKGYKRQLQQLFQNLISNALKYSKANVPPHIDISATEVTEDRKRYHVITIKDNGIGFEQQYAEKIFQMFARLHGKAEYSGTGVGLSIVKKVVENHNGIIRVESTPGAGSVFMVLLPAH